MSLTLQDWESRIPVEFRIGHVTARNVGQLKSLLELLPDDLPIDDSMPGGVELRVYNVDETSLSRDGFSPFLSIVSCDDDYLDDDDFDDDDDWGWDDDWDECEESDD